MTETPLDRDPPGQRPTSSPLPGGRTETCENNLRKLRLRAVTRKHFTRMPTARLPTVRAYRIHTEQC